MVLGLAPLLHWRLTANDTPLAPRAMAKLAAAAQAARAQRAALESQLDAVLAALDAKKIRPLLLKGSYLAAYVYPEPHLRQMNDIDLLVPSLELAAVEQTLLDLGYIASRKSPERGAGVTKHTSTFRLPRTDDPTPNPYLSAQAGRTIEPHTNLEESWYGLRADITPGVWERSIPIRINGRSARALCADDLILHLGVHLTFHLIMGYPAMVQLVDVLLTTERLQDQINWERVVQRAAERRAAWFVYAALYLAVKTLAAPVPPPALEQLARACPGTLRRYVESITLANVAARTQRAPVTTVGQRLRRGWQDRVEAARWTASPAEQWRVWRTLLDVARTDTGELIAQRVRDAALRPRAKNSPAGSPPH